MDQILGWLSRLFETWKFWVVVAPWEIGVRVRFGRKALSLNPGLHFRIPFLDHVTMVNTRLRIDGTPPVTIKGSRPGLARCLSASVGYKITDPVRAMLRFGLPSPTVMSRAQVEIASGLDADGVLAGMRGYFGKGSGIEIEFVSFVEDVEVRTYRLLQGGWIAAGHEMDPGAGRY